MNKKPLFQLGQIVMTASIAEIVQKHCIDLSPFIDRHVTGDWGNVACADADENRLSLEKGFRLLSSYTLNLPDENVTIWVLTESDRSYTTVLLPSDY